MQPKQANGATMMQEIGTSFHYLNRGTWATHVQFASLASRLESSHLDCSASQVPTHMAFKWPLEPKPFEAPSC
jgi:hypothetical protein